MEKKTKLPNLKARKKKMLVLKKIIIKINNFGSRT